MFINLDWQECKIQDISCKIRPLEFWATQRIMGLFAKATKDAGNEKEKVLEILQKSENNVIANPEFGEISKEILPAHCSDLQGLEIQPPDEERRIAVVEDLVKYEGLAMIRLQIVMQLFSISNAGQEEKEGVKKP